MRKDLGDFQTPPDLVIEVLASLDFSGDLWPRVLEPTCGRGNFIAGLLDAAIPPTEIVGIELQAEHVERASKRPLDTMGTAVTIRQADFFGLNLRADIEWQYQGPLLVIGNPPWVTNSELGTLESDNLPTKRNLKGLRGFDAMTGESNFDIAEAIWIKLITELVEEKPTIALLCKTSVARNVLSYAHKAGLPISGGILRRLNAKRWFDAAADACLFSLDVGQKIPCYDVEVYDDLWCERPVTTMGIANGHVVVDVDAHEHVSFAQGASPIEWRQGMKHDAAPVMELVRDADGNLTNKLGDVVDVEPEFVFPLAKGSDLYNGRVTKADRYVIVPQKHLGESTCHLAEYAPRLWEYLESHTEVFDKRRSAIYRGKERFSIFGIGDYSFSLYKIGIAGLYKEPRFRMIAPVAGRPMMLDDTCYLIECASAEQAATLSCLLNHSLCIKAISSGLFSDSKRPVTKRLLQRINLRAILAKVDHDALLSAAHEQLRSLGLEWQTNMNGSHSNLADWLFNSSAGKRQDQQMALLVSVI